MKASSLFCTIISLAISASAVPQGIQQNNRADNADTDPQNSTSWYKFKSLYLVNLHYYQLLTRGLSRRDSQTMAKVRLFWGEYPTFRYSPAPLPDVPTAGNQLPIV